MDERKKNSIISLVSQSFNLIHIMFLIYRNVSAMSKVLLTET